MAIRTVSVSELVTFMDCQRKHFLRYNARLSPNTESRSWQLASGNAVHYVVEQHCRQSPGELPTKDDVDALIEECLSAEFDGTSNESGQVLKYTPGVRRAVSKIPQWVWEASWYIEHDLVGHFGDEFVEKAELRGRPDLFHVGDNFVELVDIKTTAHKPLEYMLWTPQLRYYAAMLKQLYPDKLVRYRYVCVPTQGDKPPPETSPWPFKASALAEAESEILRCVSMMGEDEFRNPHYSRACDWCEYRDICKAVVTGADWKGLASEEYHERVPHS